MNYKSLNSAIRSVTNPQPKNEALTSLQENIDLYNAVLPYTVGLQSVIVLVMIEALLDGSGPISGTVSLFKNLMKKWKARVLGGKLSADQAQSFIAEYEKLSASLPTGKRNFLKASLNKMEQAAKAGDKGKLGAIATEVKDYLARNSAEVKEDYQTRERDRQMANTGQLGSSLDSKEKASKKVYGKDGVVAHKSLRSMIKKANWKGLENEKNRLAQRFADPYKTSSFENRSASMKEEQEYIAMLESALESIAEEMECDVDDLVEDMAQTPQRTRQLASKIDKAERSKRPGGIGTPEYSDKQYNSTKSGAKKLLGYRKAEKDEKSGIKLFNKEVGSKKLYGRGGRVLKRKIRSTDTTNG